MVSRNCKKVRTIWFIDLIRKNSIKADRGVKKILSKHLDYIDGLEVKFEDGEKWGIVDGYVVEREQYCLYPVSKEWCITEEQLSLV